MQIYGGRTYFWQWDLDQRLVSENLKIGDKVHFHNTKHCKALVCEAYEQYGVVLVDVPNILLQNSLPITVYRMEDDGDGGYHTQQTVSFEVKQRARPDDYVYTETETKRYDLLEDRIEELEKAFSDEKIADAVDDYLSRNPIEVEVPKKLSDLKDDAEHRTVTDQEKQAWNKKLDTTALSDAINTALAQAKASGEFDGENGITPHIGENGNWFIGETDTGNPSRGEPGHTPQKGTDYFTSEDKQEMVNAVINALPEWTGGSY